jgi:hypothetical protein
MKSALQIVLVSSKMETLSELAHGLLEHRDVQVHMCKSKQEVLNLLAEESITALLVADTIDGEKPLALVTEITKHFPLVNCGLVSDLSPEDFHEWTEGLGVFAQLSPQPTREEAKTIVETLRKLDFQLSDLEKKGNKS